MASSLTVAVAVAVLGAASAVSAIQFQPRPTGKVVLPGDGVDPLPTPAPLGFMELHKRQQGLQSVVVEVAPDNTCGFVSGSLGAADTCNTKSNTCVIVPATAGIQGFVGCCDFTSAECGFRQACFDFNQVSSQSLCTGACLVDTFTVKCLSTEAPFCNTVSFPGGAFDYFCNSVNISTALAAETTFSGETDGRSYLTLTVPLTGGTTGNPFGQFSSLPPVTVTADPPSTSSTGGGGGGGGGGSSTPVGAIVGGVIGGVAVIALIILGVWLLMRRNKKDKEKAAAAAAAAAPQQNPGIDGQSPGGAAAYGGPSGPMAAQHTGPSAYGGSDGQSTLYDPSKYPQQQPYVQGYSPPPGQNGQQPYNPYGQSPQQQPSAGYFDPNRADSASPNLSAAGYNNNRVSMQTVGSPTPSQQQFVGNPQHVSMQSFTSQPGVGVGPAYGQQQQAYAPGQPTVHEAPNSQVGHHRGEMHELA